MMLTRMLCVCLLLFASTRSQLLSKEEFEAYKVAYPEEFSGKFEGDIDINEKFRNAMIGTRKWPRGEVPYSVQSMGSRQRSAIRYALYELQNRIGGNCIRFVERTNQYNYINVISGRGCYSSVGMVGGGQQLSLGNGCYITSTIQHEFLHALGFMHEQSRSDRDNHLVIHWQNIAAKMRYNFNRKNTNNVGSRYTYGSVMHYGRYAFSMNGQPTMTPKVGGARIGLRRLHQVDVDRVRTYYGCASSELGKESSGGCFDKLSACNNWGMLCKDSRYRVYMSTNCPKKCGFC